MKTEREFIDSVYAKYELEKLRRERAAKRSRMIYIGATLAASFCFVLLGIARILPAFMGANSAAEADALTYSVTNGGGYGDMETAEKEKIFYAAKEDLKKSKNYTAGEEAVLDVTIDEHEAVAEAPMSTESGNAFLQNEIVTESAADRYSFAERAVLSVADCSFIDNGYGYTDIIFDGKRVGMIENDRHLVSVTNSSLQDGGADTADDGYNSFVRIELNADEKYVLFLSTGYFSADDIEKITQYVEN